MMLSCSVDFGSSGAPVFDMSYGEPRIVSVVSAKAEVSGEKVALGVALDSRIEELRASLSAVPAGVSAIANRRRPGDTATAGGARFMKPPVTAAVGGGQK